MNKKKNRFALLSVALGFWLIALPLTYGYIDPLIRGSDLISGILFVLLGLLSLAPHRVWSGWSIGLIGVWLQIAPLLFWAADPIMYLNDTVTGILAIILSFQLTQREEAEEIIFPKGWSYNPSGWLHRIPTVALAMLCWFFSRYMAAFQLGYITQIWDPFFVDGTFRVITSNISQSFPVSDAGMGALCYSLEFLLGWQGGADRFARMPWLVLAFAFLVIPVGIVSITLIILQPVVVGAWCSWCLATAASMLLMIVLTAGELAGVLQFLMEAKKKGNSLWQIFWKGGKLSADKTEVAPLNRSSESHPWGVSLPWNLLVSILLGIWLMASPSILSTEASAEGILKMSDYVLGPLITAFSVIALAEVFRAIRWINLLWGAGLILAPWFMQGSSSLIISNNIVVGFLIIALAWRKGKISERYGAFEKWIF